MAEDNKGDVVLVREALRHHGLNADLIVQRDGEEMFQYIERIDAGELPCPHVVLLDLNLPRRSGEALLRRLLESTLCRDVPMLIVTSSDAPGDREAVARLGAHAYFRKPSDFDEFMQLGGLVRAAIEGTAKA